MADLRIAGEVASSVAGASFSEAVALSPIEMMHQLSEQWLRGASTAERADTMRALLRHGGSSKSLLRMLEGEMGEKVLTMSSNRIPKAIMKAAGGARKQAQFTNTLSMLRQIKSTGASPADLKRLFGITMKAAVEAGLPANSLDALRRMGPERVFRGGATNIARVYDIATKESSARKLLRWATKGDPRLSGKKFLGTGPTQNLAADVRAQIDELEGIAKSKLSEEVSAAKGAFGKTSAAVKGGAARVGEAISPRGLTAAEEGTVGQLTKAGAKGLGRGAKLARSLGGVGTLLTVPLLGFEVYDSLVGKSKRARAMVEASRRDGTASVSQELMYDILDKRADLQARRAMLSRDPQLMQSIVQTLGGGGPNKLTTSEAGFGIDLGPQGTSPGEMDKLLNQLLGQMRGM